MNDWIPQLNGISHSWIGAIGRACWQGGLALLLVWLISRWAKALPAAAKVWLWRLAWLKLIVILVTPVFLDIPLLKPAPTPNVESQPPNRFTVAHPSTAPVGITPPIRTIMKPDFHAYVFLLWLAGIAWFAGRLVAQWRRTVRLTTAAQPLADPDLRQTCTDLARIMGIRKPPAIVQSHEAAAPMLVRRTIVLPAQQTLDAQQLRMALAHELAHCKRHDLLWLWLTALCEGLFFFHPLLWLTRREWLLQQELATDALALRVTSGAPAAYASMLLQFSAPKQAHVPMAALGIFESNKALKRRLMAMKTLRNKTKTFGLLLTAVALIAACAAVMPWRLVAQERPADAVAEIKRLQSENERLREELSRLKAQERDRAGRPARDAELERLSAEIADVRKQREEAAKTYVATHPKVKELTARMDALQKELAMRKEASSGLHEDSRQRSADVAALQQRAISQEELALAQQELDNLKRQMEAGKATQDQLLRAQREVYDLKRQVSNAEEVKGLIREEIALVEKLLQECRKRIELGIQSSEAAIPLQRELLRLKRELLTVDDRAVPLRNPKF